MPKITLNFFGETINSDVPKTLSSLRSEISKLFYFSPQDAAEILLTYKLNGEKKIIANDQDLKTFLNSKSKMIDLDISQTSKIYKDSLNKLQEENSKDKNILKELLKKNEELNNLKQTKFTSEKKELKEIDLKITELFKKKQEIGRKLYEEIKQIDKEIKENDKNIQEIQKKLGVSVPEIKPKESLKHEKMLLHFKNRFAPPKITLKNPNPHPSPHVHPCFFPQKYHAQPNKEQILRARPKICPPVHPCFFERKYQVHPRKKNLEVKFAKTEYIDIPKDTSKDESSNEIDLKMRTIDDWGNCLMLKTKQITDKIAEKFRGLETLNITLNKKEEKKEEKNEKPKKVGILYGTRPEGIPKKMNQCPTMGNIFEKVKLADKIVHFGVKCDQCGKYPIIGCRYKCSVCPNFDYCEDCEKKYSKTHNHPFYKINDPSMKQLIYKNVAKK